MRTLAIGDIHGCRASLENLADHVGFESEDTIVTLGDYVDRGPDTKGVIDFLLGLQQTHNLVHLRGNHEIMMLQARSDRSMLTNWLDVGGDAVLDSYGASNFDAVPQAHWDFIETSAAFYENETHFFVHANAYPDVPLKDQPDFMLYWEVFNNPLPHQSGKVMVCGHTSQKSGDPVSVGHAICIDTFAHGGGWLSCLDTGTGVLWRTNEKGERRTDLIIDFEVEAGPAD